MHKRVCLLGVSLDTFLTILRIRDHHGGTGRAARSGVPGVARIPGRRARPARGAPGTGCIHTAAVENPRARTGERGATPRRPARLAAVRARSRRPPVPQSAVRTSYRVRRTRLHAGRASRHSQQPFRGERAGRRSCAQYRHSIRNLIPTFSDLDVSPSVRGEHTSLVSNVSTSPYRQVILVPMNRTGPSLREAQQDEAPSSARGGRQLR